MKLSLIRTSSLVHILKSSYHILYLFCDSSSSNRMLGDILMLSEGRSGVDDVYSLKDGMLGLCSPTCILSSP